MVSDLDGDGLMGIVSDWHSEYDDNTLSYGDGDELQPSPFLWMGGEIVVASAIRMSSYTIKLYDDQRLVNEDGRGGPPTIELRRGWCS